LREGEAFEGGRGKGGVAALREMKSHIGRKGRGKVGGMHLGRRQGAGEALLVRRTFGVRAVRRKRMRAQAASVNGAT
jgi:hypothetical protein